MPKNAKQGDGGTTANRANDRLCMLVDVDSRLVPSENEARTRRKGGFVCGAVAGNRMTGNPVKADHSLRWPRMYEDVRDDAAMMHVMNENMYGAFSL